MSEKKLVRRMEDFSDAVNGMTAAMERTSEERPETNLKISDFKRKFPDAIYLEPATKIPTGGIRHAEIDKQKDYLHEYVVGIFESQMIQGQLDFFLTGLPGDDYCRWVVPVNKAVGVPRFVAQHLAKGLGWKQMKPLAKSHDPQSFNSEEMTKPFQEFEYVKRGHFHPINAY
jgi:hypothetical protein